MNIKCLLRIHAVVLGLISVCWFSSGCVSHHLGPGSASLIHVYGHELKGSDRGLHLSTNTDLLALVQRVREAGGFKEGLYRVTVSTFEGSNVTRRIIDLREVSLIDAERTRFPNGTTIYVVEAPYTGLPIGK